MRTSSPRLLEVFCTSFMLRVIRPTLSSSSWSLFLRSDNSLTRLLHGLSCVQTASIPTIKANWIFTKLTIDRQGKAINLHKRSALSWRSALAVALPAPWLLSSAYAQAPAKSKSIWGIQKVALKGLLAVGVSPDSANDVWRAETFLGKHLPFDHPCVLFTNQGK